MNRTEAQVVINALRQSVDMLENAVTVVDAVSAPDDVREKSMDKLVTDWQQNVSGFVANSLRITAENRRIRLAARGIV